MRKYHQKQLKRIENSVRSEFKADRIDIAFLSYKASMSDSIESFYLAAKEDPNCDAFWIPVLYFERNIKQRNNFVNNSSDKDGTVGKMIYEYVKKAV